MSSRSRIGIAWYRKPEWDLLRAAASDPEVLEGTYEEWLAGAERTLGDLQRAGIAVERVEVAVADLQAWCQARSIPLDGSARSSFAAELVRQRDSHPHRGGV
jgi:hypothetical protein